MPWSTSLCQKWHGDFLLFGDNPHFWLIGRRLKISRKADHLAISPPVEGGNRKMFKAFGQYTHSCPDGSMRGRETTSTPIWSKVPNTLCAYGYKAENSFCYFRPNRDFVLGSQVRGGSIRMNFSLIGRGIKNFSVFCSNADHTSSG